MSYRLIHLSGSLTGRVREVGDRETVLGRDPASAQVVFGPEDRGVSRRHALLVHEKGALLLRDLKSATGTFLDGERVAEAELRDGDVFELGRGGPRVRVELEEQGTLVMTAAASAAMAPPSGPRPRAAPTTALGPGSKLRLTFLSGSRQGSFLDLAGSVIHLGRAAGRSSASRTATSSWTSRAPTARS
jgi:pSer/pThr/pTyr-binding forkhead associated (FHA) protein